MKTLLRIAALIIAFSPVIAISQAGCYTAGGLFTESFNGSGVCGFGGAKSCLQPWTYSGGAFGLSIGASPAFASGTALGNVPCALSANFATNASGHAIQTNLSTAAPASTLADWYFLYSFSTAPSSFATIFSVANLGVGYQMECFHASSTSIECQGSTTSAAVTIAANTSYLMHVHSDTTLANCYFSVNGGSNQTFTCASQPENYVNFGSTGDTAGAWSISNVYATSTVTAAFPPSLLTQFSGTNGATATTSTLATNTVGGNGAWTGVAGGFTYSTTVSQAFLAPVLVNGTNYTNNTGVSLRFDCSGNNNAIYTWQADSTTNADAQGWFYLTLLASDTGDYDIAYIQGSADGVWLHEKGTGSQLQITMEATQGGAANHGWIPISTATWYYWKLAYHANGQHELAVYNAAGTQLGLITYQAVPSATDVPILVELGHSGGANCPGGEFFYYSGLLVNYRGVDFFSKGPLSYSHASTIQ